MIIKDDNLRYNKSIRLEFDVIKEFEFKKMTQIIIVLYLCLMINNRFVFVCNVCNSFIHLDMIN